MGQRCAGRPYAQQSCATRPEKKRPFLIPMRFVAVCGKGHIQDFPFMEWVHRAVPATATCRLRARAGRSSAGLTGITIECSCGQKRTLGNIFEFDKNKGGALHRIGCDCLGLRQWLGEFETQTARCGEFLRVLQRGASNVYFPSVVSSIYLPLWAEAADRDIIKDLEDPTIWSLLSAGLVSGKIAPERCEEVSADDLEKDDLLAAANRKLAGQPVQSGARVQTDEEQYRQSEFEALERNAAEKSRLVRQKGEAGGLPTRSDAPILQNLPCPQTARDTGAVRFHTHFAARWTNRKRPSARTETRSEDRLASRHCCAWRRAVSGIQHSTA